MPAPTEAKTRYKEEHMTVLIRLELGKYSMDELISLFKMNILSRDEIMSEMKRRGMNEFKILTILRAS